MSPQPHPWVKLSAVASYVFLVAVFALVVWTLTAKVARDSSARNRSVIEQLRDGCNRGMLRNGYSRARAQTPLEHRMVVAYFAITDCEATYRVGAIRSRTVYLPADLQRCFIRLTGRLYWRHHPVTTKTRDLRRICRRQP